MAETATTPVTTPVTDAPGTGAQTPATETPATDQGATNTATETKTQEYSQESLAAMVRREVDRATNRLGNENKKLREENERLKKEKLSDEDLKKYELDKRDNELAEREKALADRENRLFAIKAIKNAGLDDGSGSSLDIVDFVMADDEDGILTKVKSFSELVKRTVKAQVDAVFKANGRTPGVGSDTAAAAGGQNDLGVRMGKNAAASNKQSSDIRNKYLGGN